MSQSDVAHIQNSIEVAKGQVKLAAAVASLQKNKDFKLLITEGYIREESIRLVSSLSSPALQSADNQAKILRDMHAIGSLQDFLDTTLSNGERAKVAILQHEEELARIDSGEED